MLFFLPKAIIVKIEEMKDFEKGMTGMYAK